MYRYELKNNHYIVEIDNKRFLIDTGWPYSFSFNNVGHVIIDNQLFPLTTKPSNIGVEETRELVGIVPDGFIGMDIISKLGFTVYKNGELEFKVNNIDGNEVRMNKSWPLLIPISCNSVNGMFIVDLGAKYGYASKRVLNGSRPIGVVEDYNPMLKHFNSNLFNIEIKIGNQTRYIDVGDSEKVAPTFTNGIIMVGNITTLFDEVCVIDTIKGRLILK